MKSDITVKQCILFSPHNFVKWNGGHCVMERLDHPRSDTFVLIIELTS